MPDRPTRPELARGVRRSARVVARSLRGLDRERLGALAAAVVLLIVLATPWYELSATAPGSGAGHVTAHQSLSGWDALSRGSLVCAIVAVAAIALLLTRTGAAIDGLGAWGRRAARTRTDGRIIAGAGAVAAVCVLWSIASHPAPHVAVAGVAATTQLRYGIVLGLLSAIALGAFGARIALLADAATRRPARAAGDGPILRARTLDDRHDPRTRVRRRGRQRPA